MTKLIALDDETVRLLQLLAEEEGNITPEQYIARAVKRDDENRHEAWSRKQQKYVRVKCDFRGCKETNVLLPGDQAD